MITLGSTGYSIPQALAELVDNSIDEASDDGPLVIRVTISRSAIKVEDNARGMSEGQAKDAFILGKSNKTGKLKLGLYGLGLKTACASLGSRYYVKTKSHGQNKWFILEFDEDRWMTDDSLNWNNFPVHWINAKDSEHGTTVEIDRLKRDIPPVVVGKTRDDFSARYRPFLEKRNVTITVNGKTCSPRQLDLVEKHSVDRVLPSGRRLYGWFGLMRESSQKGYYGFATFRNGRMITCYDKLGFSAHATLARIVGELNLDHVPVTHDKRDFLRDSEEFTEVDTVLRVNQEFRSMQQRARQPHHSSRPTNLGIEKGIGDDAVEQSIGDVLSSVVEVSLNERCLVCNTELKGPTKLCPLCGSDIGSNPQTPSPSQEFQVQTIKFAIGDKIVPVRHTFSDIGFNGPMFQCDTESEGFRVVSNIGFPAFRSTKDRRF